MIVMGYNYAEMDHNEKKMNSAGQLVREGYDLNVKIRKVLHDAVVPTYATPGSAGFDLVAMEDVVIEPGQMAKVRTGLAMELPPGYELQIRPRSGISAKTTLRISNAPGTVDADYRGEIAVLVENLFTGREWPRLVSHAYRLGDEPAEYVDDFVKPGTYKIRKGDRIAQGVIAPVYRANFEVVEELEETERGAGGFGSTGV
jgi:dUTP pyrophosphatase